MQGTGQALLDNEPKIESSLKVTQLRTSICFGSLTLFLHHSSFESKIKHIKSSNILIRISKISDIAYKYIKAIFTIFGSERKDIQMLYVCMSVCLFIML